LLFWTFILISPGLHRVAPNVEEVLIDCSGPRMQTKSSDQVLENKKAALLKSLENFNNNNNACDRTIVFCNTIDQCRRVENILQREDRSGRTRTLLPYHGAIDAATRDNNIIEFSRPLLKVK
jgi:ATP-dependent RNA helicase DDX18/HAS1